MPISELPIITTFKRSNLLAKIGMLLLLLVAAVLIWPLIVLVVYWLVLGSLRARKWRFILTGILVGPALIMQVYWARPAWQLATAQQSLPEASTQTAEVNPTSPPSVQGASTSTQPGTQVLQVISGDSFDIDQSGQAYRVKLIGLTAPAMATESTPAACYGQEAQSFLSSLLQGQSVQLTNDSTLGDKDAQGRLLRYAALKDGTDINQLLLESGLARVDSSQPFSRQTEFSQLESAARQSLKGQWAVCSSTTGPGAPAASSSAGLKVVH